MTKKCAESVDFLLGVFNMETTCIVYKNLQHIIPPRTPEL